MRFIGNGTQKPPHHEPLRSSFSTAPSPPTTIARHAPTFHSTSPRAVALPPVCRPACAVTAALIDPSMSLVRSCMRSLRTQTSSAVSESAAARLGNKAMTAAKRNTWRQCASRWPRATARDAGAKVSKLYQSATSATVGLTHESGRAVTLDVTGVADLPEPTRRWRRRQRLGLRLRLRLRLRLLLSIVVIRARVVRAAARAHPRDADACGDDLSE